MRRYPQKGTAPTVLFGCGGLAFERCPDLESNQGHEDFQDNFSRSGEAPCFGYAPFPSLQHVHLQVAHAPVDGDADIMGVASQCEV